MAMEPSSRWLFSMRATIVRGSATPLAFRVWAIRVFLSASL